MSVTYAESESCERIVLQTGDFVKLIYLDTQAEHIDNGTRDETIARNSLAALELCEAACLSSTHGCIVPLPIATFTSPQPSDWRPGQPYSGAGGGRDGRKLV